MKKAPPSFDFFFNDWLGGTSHMSAIEERAYLRLIIYQWQNGHIPTTDRQRMRVAMCSESEWIDAWETLRDKFIEIDAKKIINCETSGTVLVNQKCHQKREEAIPTYHERVTRAVNNGKKGGRPKGKPQSADGTRKPTNNPDRNPEETYIGSYIGSNIEPTIEPICKPTANPRLEEGRGKREALKASNSLEIESANTVCVLEESARACATQSEPPPPPPPPNQPSTHKRPRDSQEFFREDYLPESHRTPEVQSAWTAWLTYVLDRDGRLVPAAVDAWAMDTSRREPTVAAERLRESVSRLAPSGPYWTELTGSRAGPAPKVDPMDELRSKLEDAKQYFAQKSKEALNAS